LAIAICILYVAASTTSADSTINLYIPLGILGILLAVIVVSVIALVQELREYWSTHEEKVKGFEKGGELMTVDEGQKMLMM
jgi:uncharacterized protein YpmB